MSRSAFRRHLYHVDEGKRRATGLSARRRPPGAPSGRGRGVAAWWGGCRAPVLQLRGSSRPLPRPDGRQSSAGRGPAPGHASTRRSAAAISFTRSRILKRGCSGSRAIAHLRRFVDARRLRSALERFTQRPEPSERDDLELLAVRDLLQRHLDPEDRALLILRYLHGFQATELAAMTGRTPEAVRQRLARAKSRLIRAAGRQPSPSEEEKET